MKKTPLKAGNGQIEARRFCGGEHCIRWNIGPGVSVLASQQEEEGAFSWPFEYYLMNHFQRCEQA